MTTEAISGVQQHMLLAMLTEWGEDGLHKHLQLLQYTYAQKLGWLAEACEKHLQGLCRWRVPEFGMFSWLELLGVKNTAELVDNLIDEHGLAFVPGEVFKATEGEGPDNFFRVSFSLLTEDLADKAMQRFRSALLSGAGLGAKRGGEKRKLATDAEQSESRTRLA